VKTHDENRVALAVVLTAVIAINGTAPHTRGANGDDTPAADAPATKSLSYRSPLALAVAPNGKTIYVSDRTAGSVVTLDAESKTRCGEIALDGEPRGVALSADGRTLFVAEHDAGTVAVIDTAQGKVTSRVAVGKWPMSVALAEQSERLYVGNQDDHSVSVIDLTTDPPVAIGRIAVTREPSSLAVTPDEQRVVVANMMPHGVGTDPRLAAEVSIIDTAAPEVASQVKLPPGSTMVNGVCLSPDGRWAYVVHGLGRFNLPITQLERGWVNTFALSIIDVSGGERLVTLLLDDLSQGAADPNSVVCSADGNRLWISHAGVHEISLIDIGRVHRLLAGDVPAELTALRDGVQPNVWVRIQQQPTEIAELENDLTALYIAGAIHRAPSGGTGPRGIALSPDGESLFVANHYSGEVAVLAASDGALHGTIALGAQAAPDAVRRGEMIFHDATHAFQRWHSCASCHANEGRIDGLRWDFLADGIGNAKDTMSLVNLDHTEPLNRRATVATAADCALGGLQSTNMLVPTEEEVADLLAYLTSLKPVPSPHRTPQGELTELAQQGQALFEGKARCDGCHPGPYFTDRKMHNVGVLSPNEPDGRYDTPSLVEAYRTAPYLHDGRSLTLKDVLTTDNVDHKHGKTEALTEPELDAIVAYLHQL
jgi:YVTN family beta-propeller protein